MWAFWRKRGDLAILVGDRPAAVVVLVAGRHEQHGEDDHRIPVDVDGMVQSLAKPGGLQRHLALADVMNRMADLPQQRGRVVLVYATGADMRLVCIGECMVEFLRQDDGLWRQGFAGDTLNVAWALRALLPREVQVEYLTRVGSDALSEAMLAMLQGAGIGTATITRDARRTLGLYTIQTDASGERSFAYWRSDSAAKGLAQDVGHLAFALAGADLVYLSGITLAILPPADRVGLIATLGARGARGYRLAFDPNIRPRLWEDMATAREEITAMAGLSDIVLPSHDDEAMAFGDTDSAATLARYAGLGVPEVVVKDGTRPTKVRADGESLDRAVTPAAQTLDTTGAGDSFNGAYLAARLLGLSADAAVFVGQAVSACVVGHRGALVPPEALRRASGWA